MMRIVECREIPLAVLALDEICFPLDTPVRIEGARWWLALDGKTEVGYAGLRPCREPGNEGIGFLCRVGVVPSARGRGLQRRMIRVRERAARAMGLRELVTYCATWNVASANNLMACGYRLEVPIVQWAGPGQLYWRRRL